jgi:electron transfer flavoprotein beta subunit
MIAVCIKWIGDPIPSGISAADEAAIEMALRHGTTTGSSVIAVTVGPRAADRGLRTALACGAKTAIRVDTPVTLDSASVAAALAPVVAHSEAIWCGDYSFDRGTGSVPAFLAAQLERQQALGIVAAELGAPLRVTRRLDGGRREVLRITGPAVISVEGAIARLRRAALRPALDALTSEVLPYGTNVAASGNTSPVVVRPYRPRSLVLPPPRGSTLERMHLLLESAANEHQGETIEVEPSEAARLIVDALRRWGYLDAVVNASSSPGRKDGV